MATDAALTDRELVEAFGRDGFVVVPGLLSGDDLDRLGAAVDGGVARRKGHDNRGLADKSRYEQSFIQCQNLWEDCPAVRPLTFHPRVTETAARLLGAERIRLWHDQALYKEPGGRLTDPHQDHPYWPIAETDAITAWIPLQGSTLAGGAMGYLPGSHRLGFHKFVNIFLGEPDDVLAREELAGIDPVFVEVPRGGVAYHHALTFHLARPNTTDGVRRVHTAIYFRDGCTRRSPRPHPSVDRAGIEVGQPIISDVTPVAWPRPGGDLPDPPAPPEDSMGGLMPERGGT
ncbi:MAG: phytanoyl-CoA dioxygenase family protein [Actinobacteria bacterium]|nr:MAG: phytanoyl-CoA dioxygenase family protein [Actinomycetota bacterium]